jgi:hypothetical protein
MTRSSQLGDTPAEPGRRLRVTAETAIGVIDTSRSVATTTVTLPVLINSVLVHGTAGVSALAWSASR